LHEVESDKQADSGRTTWRDSDQDNRTGHVDYSECNHGKECLIPFGDDEPGISVHTFWYQSRDLRHSHVECNTNKRKRNLQKLTGQDIESESSINEKTIEFSDPTDDHGLKQGQEE